MSYNYFCVAHCPCKPYLAPLVAPNHTPPYTNKHPLTFLTSTRSLSRGTCLVTLSGRYVDYIELISHSNPLTHSLGVYRLCRIADNRITIFTQSPCFTLLFCIYIIYMYIYIYIYMVFVGMLVPSHKPNTDSWTQKQRRYIVVMCIYAIEDSWSTVVTQALC